MIKKRNLIIFVVLFITLLVPNKVDAIKDTYQIDMLLNEKTNALYYEGEVTQGELKSGYLSASEQSGKNNLVCDNNDVQYWFFKYVTTCSLDKSKTEYSSCKSDNYTGIGKSEALSKEKCKVAALGNSAVCKNSNGFYTVTINDSSIVYNTISGINHVNEENYGIWAKSNPNKEIYAKSALSKTKCTWSEGSTTVGKVEVEQSIYKATYNNPDGSKETATAYCVDPGKDFGNQNFGLVKEYKIDNCISSNQDAGCRYAATVLKAKEYGSDYLTTLIALRLFAASDRADGSVVRLAKVAQSYRDTANYITNNGYSGSSTSPKKGVLYGDATSIEQLENAIKIYKEVKAGFTFWKPKFDLISQTPYDFETETSKYLIETDFDPSTSIVSIISPDLGNLTDYTSSRCGANNDKYCLELTVHVDASIARNGFETNIEITFNHPDDIISKVGVYSPLDYETSVIQYMLVFDEGGESNDNLLLKIDPIEEENPVCSPVPNEAGKYYDRNGNVVDYNGYSASCLCRIDTLADGTKEYYINYLTKVSREIYIDSACGCQRRNGKWYVTYPEETDEATYNAVCLPTTTTCPNQPVTYDMPNSCDERNTGTIKDPDMCYILDSDNANYKTNYGNEFCDVYCRENLSFTFMEKADAIAGRFFKHNVSAKYSSLQNLSTVILSSRQCTSIIDYDTWESRYTSANNEVLSAWNELKRLETLYNHEQSHSESESRTCSNSVCDCGCNIELGEGETCPESEKCTNTIAGGTISDSWTWYSSSGSYTWTDANGRNHTTSDSRTSGSSGYSFNCNRCGGTSAYLNGNDGTSVYQSYRQALNRYTGAVNSRDELLTKIKNCNFDDTSSTYNRVMSYTPGNKVTIDYDENRDPYKSNSGNFDISTANDLTSPVVAKRGYSTQSNWEDYCSTCTNDLQSLSDTSSSVSLAYWSCTGSETGASCTNSGVSIPNNRLANIVVERESLHYQKNKFYTQVYTGIVSTQASSVGYWIPMDDRVYPVGIRRQSGTYGVYVKYENLGINNHFSTGGNYTCKYNVRNDLTVFDCDDGYHTCYPCVGSECGSDSGLGVYFRSIDLTDVFPNSVYSTNYVNSLVSNTRPIGDNWFNGDGNGIGRLVTTEIQELGNDIWIQKTPQYKVRLTPSARKGIQNYNKLRTYLDYSIDCNGLECLSTFLNGNDGLRSSSILGNNYSNLYKKDTTIVGSTRLYNYQVR